MEFIVNAFQTVLNFINGVLYYIVFFFGGKAVFAHVFKAVLIMQIALLIYTLLRPKRWKWVTLFVTEGLFLFGALCLLGVGFTQDSIPYIGYGATSAVMGFLMLMLTLGCSVREKRPKG